MKKLYFMFIIFIFCGISIFGDDATREEVDFLLFSPNSGNEFENEEQASAQLNKLAQYLSNKNINPGQIIIYGYAAHVPNDIDSLALSIERAVFVMNELQKRGVSKELFSDPVGHGEVYQWGDNSDENARRPNRRVRVLLDGESPIPITNEIITAEAETPKVETPAETPKVEPPNTVIEKPAAPEYAPKKASFDILRLLLPLLAILAAAIILFLLLKKRSRKTAHKDKPANKQTDITPQIAPVPVPAPKPAPVPEPAPKPAPVPEPAPKPAPVPEPAHISEPVGAAATYTVNLDEEIRLRAYEISIRRNEPGDYRDQDWYNAVREISARYTASGHSVFYDGGYWWASSKDS
jgi:outer membrane biosynthesis protein TonB